MLRESTRVGCRFLGFPRRQHRLEGELFQCYLAHGLVTHDVADFQTFDRELALLVFSADHFAGNRIYLIAEAI
jgi:hypothetical protein